MKYMLCFFVAFSVAVSADNNDFDRRCVRMCTEIYKPICASDGEKFRMFPSACVLAGENCNLRLKSMKVFKITTRKMCHAELFESEEVDLKKKCLKPCVLNYDPICGFDGVNYITFGNHCDMEVQTCLNGGKKWQIVRKGECIPSYIN